MSEIRAEPSGHCHMPLSLGLLAAGCPRRHLSFTDGDIRASWTCHRAPALWSLNSYNYHHIRPLSVAIEWLLLILCVLEVPGLYFNSEICYLERYLLLSSLQTSASNYTTAPPFRIGIIKFLDLLNDTIFRKLGLFPKRFILWNIRRLTKSRSSVILEVTHHCQNLRELTSV